MSGIAAASKRARAMKRPRSGDYQSAAKKPRLAMKNRSKFMPARPAGKQELKNFDTALGFSFDTTGEVSSTGGTGFINLIDQGDDAVNREGRKITLKSVQIRGRCDFAPAAGATAATISYLYLMLDTQANGAAPPIATVFTSTAFGTHFLNLDNSQRFRVLKKWVINQAPQAGATTAYNKCVEPIEYYTKCNIPISFTSTGNGISDIRSNNLFLAYGSDSNADDLVTFTGASRVRFVG